LDYDVDEVEKRGRKKEKDNAEFAEKRTQERRLKSVVQGR
jgi:hypothetical protein